MPEFSKTWQTLHDSAIKYTAMIKLPGSGIFEITVNTRILNAMKTVAIRVTGRVQGVWFRASTRDEAQRLGLTGFVRNEPDGTVYIEVTGTEKQINRLLAWCQEGPRHARVEQVEKKEIRYTEFDAFTIQRQG